MAMASSVNDESQSNIIKIHAKLIPKLSEYISPDLTPTWNKFKNYMAVYITEADLANCTDIFTVCNKLRNQGRISYGSYDVLSDVFKTINHQICYDIVADYTKQIKEVQPQSKDGAPYRTLPVEENSPQGFPSIGAKLRIDRVEPDQSKDVIYGMFLDVFSKLLDETMELPVHTRAERMTDLVDLKKNFCRFQERLRKDKIHLSKVTEGCLELLFTVETREALHKLWQMNQSGELLAILQEFVSEDLLKVCKAHLIQLTLHITEEDYQECLTKIGEVEEKEITERKLDDTVFSAQVLFSEKERQTQQSTYTMGAVRAKERQTRQGVLLEASMVPDKTTHRSQPLNSADGSDVKQTSLSETFHSKFSVRTPFDKEPAYINRIISMSDGRVCVVDYFNYKIKLYTDEYVLCDEVRVPGCTAVTCVDDDTVAVATLSGDITRYSVKGNKITQTGRTLHIDGKIYDIAYRRGEFITRYDKHNTDYTCCGSKVIVKQDRGLLFFDTIQYDPLSDCVILGSYMQDTVTCYTLDGDIKWSVTLDATPTGMVVVHGVVLVADYNNTVRQITMDGRLLSSTLLTKDHDISRPNATTYQHKLHRLLVTRLRDKNVMVFNLRLQ